MKGALRRWLWGGAAVGALLVLGSLGSEGGREIEPTSFGTTPSGHRAVLELLTELSLSAGRSFEPPERLDAHATIWWVEPEGVCDARIAVSQNVDVLDPTAVTWRATEWIRAGGTAVVFLEPEGAGRVVCDAIAGVDLPARIPTPGDSTGAHVRGTATAQARDLSLEGMWVFDSPADWKIVAEATPIVTEDAASETARPFALERGLGEGRLVVVADSGFLRNGALARADASLLAVDLARAYGPPAFDERAHGIAPAGDAIRYLAASPAAPVFLGLALLGLAVAWRGLAYPTRRADDASTPAASLESFVDSMAGLYAGTRDHQRVAERYRETTAARLRRHFSLPPSVTEAVLAERVRREKSGSPQALTALERTPHVERAADLKALVIQLDELVEEVTR